jgi:hypothetical protein
LKKHLQIISYIKADFKKKMTIESVLFPNPLGKCLWLLMMDYCPTLHFKHGHIKSQKVALAAIERCDVDEEKEKNNNQKGVKHVESGIGCNGKV